MESTPLIAFDQHAATTVAAVLLPGQRTPALHSLASDSPTLLRFVKRLQRHVGAVRCCYEAGKTFGPTCCALVIGCRSFCCGTAAASRRRRRPGPSAITRGFGPQT